MPLDFSQVHLPNFQSHNAQQLTGDRQLLRKATVIAFHDKQRIFYTLAEAYWWENGAKAEQEGTLCSVWIYDIDPATSILRGTAGGFGEACGHGYHRESAALSDALISAGVKGLPYFEGAGDPAMRSALLAVAASMPDWQSCPMTYLY